MREMEIPYIDDLSKNKTTVKRHIGWLQVMDVWVIARPEEWYWIPKWKNRFYQIIEILRWNAIAVRFYR